MILLDHERELTIETFAVLAEAYREVSQKEYATYDLIYHRFRTKWPIVMYELLKKKEKEWNLYIDKNPYDIEGYIRSTWETNMMNLLSFEQIHAVVNGMELSYRNDQHVFHHHHVAVW